MERSWPSPVYLRWDYRRTVKLQRVADSGARDQSNDAITAHNHEPVLPGVNHTLQRLEGGQVLHIAGEQVFRGLPASERDRFFRKPGSNRPRTLAQVPPGLFPQYLA